MTEIIQIIANIASVIVAVGALIVAFCIERRNQLRFNDQLKQSREIAIANMKPLLTIHPKSYIDHKGIALANRGVGTAVITDIEFEKDGCTTRSLVELFDLGPGFMWDTFWKFSSDKYYLPANEKYQLVKLTTERLVAQGLSDKSALELLVKWQEQKSGIKVRVEYTDLLGNALDPYLTTLT